MDHQGNEEPTLAGKSPISRKLLNFPSTGLDAAGWSIVCAFLFGATLVIGSVVISFFIGQSWQHATNVLVCAFGCTCGWVTGVIVSPYAASQGEDEDQDERQVFAGYRKAMAAFVGGYLVSKVDRVFEISIEHGTWMVQYLLLPRMMLCGTCLLTTALLIYVVRRYAVA